MVAAGALALEGVRVVRGGARLLGPLTLSLASAGLTAVMGPNGAGKTTLLRALHGIERLSGGRVLWPGGAAPDRHAQAFLFQTPILMRRSVRDCIAYPLRLDGVGRAEARARAGEIGARLGLGPRLDRPAQVLSGGERQKLALARALVRAPKVMFLDEPCASLDGRATAEIETILAATRDAGVRIFLATHDRGQARRLADEVIFLHNGEAVESGPAEGFFAGPQTAAARAYLAGDLLP